MKAAQTMAKPAVNRALNQLARLYGVLTSYEDVSHQQRPASPEGLLRVLQIMGAPVDGLEGVHDAIRSRRLERWREVVEPVIVAWEGGAVIRLRLPEETAGRSYEASITLETGEQRTIRGTVAELPLLHVRELEGSRFHVRELSLDARLPLGYHQLRFQAGGIEGQSTLISAPRVSWQFPADKERLWGVFLPLYALHSHRSQGAGDFGDLAALMDWVADLGGSMVASLPLLANQWELSDNPSPYSPSSRLFWNEFYLDLQQIEGFSSSPRAMEIVSTAQDDIARMRSERLVDYTGQMAIKRAVLEVLADEFFASSSPAHQAFADYCRQTPELENFARYRAVGERQGKVWHLWPEKARHGTISAADYDDRICRYHLYTQWQVERQLGALAQEANRRELLWYLDFPLGVNGAGFDAWRWRDVFAWGAAGGAPPDTFFTKGQNWGFPPIHPDKLRRQGYRYWIASLQRHLAYARVLRIDHAMSLQRLYWVPDDMDAKNGIYVRYPTDELFALLSLESHRHRSWIVGENLGTVSDAINAAFDTHEVAGMYVVQLEARPDSDPPLRAVPRRSVASLNTHDTPQWSAFWSGLDIDNSLDLELVDEEEAERQRVERSNMRRRLLEYLAAEGFLEERTFDPQRAMEAVLEWLAASEARVVLVNLEDLWKETEPQNTPGTFLERPNWRRKAQYSLEEFRSLSFVDRALGAVAERRRVKNNAAVNTGEQQ